MNIETRLRKQHLYLMRHPEAFLYAGIILLGESRIERDEAKCPTAYTDGVNKVYGEKFATSLTDAQLRGLILHENLHVALLHLPRHQAQLKSDPQTMNAAMDYVVNSIILSMKDTANITLPECRLYDPKYTGWSVAQVYADLKKQEENGGSTGQPLDQHDPDGAMEGLSEEQVKDLAKQVTDALQQAATLAGMHGIKVPREITEALAPKVDWKAVMRDFVTSNSRGRDDYSWSRLNRRRLVDDLYLPGVVSECVEELVIAIDTSGSIQGSILAQFTACVADICQQVNPTKVRILWWDTQVHGEQVFTENYDNIRHVLKPQGGGGTRVGCVAEYIRSKRLTPQALIVLTDGYVESSPVWGITLPTLWVVTERKNWSPPAGQVVKVEG